jgi:CRP-like cAMP-binding protein
MARKKPTVFIQPRERGNTNDKIDRQLLHQFLWKYRDRSNFVTFQSGELAEMLGISIWQMSRILGEMTEKGLLRKVGKKYSVTEPALASWAPD